MATKYIVNNLTGQTINGDLTINGNVVITGTTNTRKYEVYTAILTQGGGDNYQSFAWEYLDPTPEVPILLVGVSYYIDSNDSDTDFTICGAPSNSSGTNFVANGAQPVWQPPFEIEGDYIQIQWNTGAPVTTVLENTIGDIWFSYGSVGQYGVHSSSLFTINKSMATIGSTVNGVQSGELASIYSFFNDSVFYINTTINFEATDNLLVYTPIEIRVYN